jgi:hypothetical protein
MCCVKFRLVRVLIVRHVDDCLPRGNIEGIIVHEVGYWWKTAPWLELYRPAEGINNRHAEDRSFNSRLYGRNFHVSRTNMDCVGASK